MNSLVVQVTLGTYLYADGEANAPGRHGLDESGNRKLRSLFQQPHHHGPQTKVRLTVASDYAVEALKSLGTDKVSFAYLVPRLKH